MRLFVDTQGTIIETSTPLHAGLNVIGTVYGCTEQDFTLVPFHADILQKENVSSADIDAAGVMIFLKNGKVAWAAPDVCAIRDLFYAKQGEGRWVLSDNFFEIASAFSSLTLHQENAIFFVRHGYFSPGQTFFREIFRVRPGAQLRFDGVNTVEESVWPKRES